MFYHAPEEYDAECKKTLTLRLPSQPFVDLGEVVAYLPCNVAQKSKLYDLMDVFVGFQSL